MYDVIVVGSRCAGSATGMLLARCGYRVLIVDRATFPSDALCTHHLSVPAVALLERWGLLDRLAATGCPVSDGTAATVGASTVEVPNPVVAGVNVSLAPRRAVLDSLLLDAAREAGTEVRQEFTVRDLVWDGDRVTGLVGHGPDGHSVCELARVVVGADGRQSLVARIVGAQTYGEQPATACCYYAYWRGATQTTPAWLFTDSTSIGLIPTHDDLACIVVRLTVSEWARFKRQPEAVYLAEVARFRWLADELQSASRESRFVGTADMSGRSRHPWGPGWAPRRRRRPTLRPNGMGRHCRCVLAGRASGHRIGRRSVGASSPRRRLVRLPPGA